MANDKVYTGKVMLLDDNGDIEHQAVNEIIIDSNVGRTRCEEQLYRDLYVVSLRACGRRRTS